MRCVTKTGAPQASSLGLILGVPIALALTWPLFEFEIQNLGRAGENLVGFLRRFAVSPDLAYLGKLLALLGETLLIAAVASVAAIAVSLPTAFFAARNTSPHRLVSGPIRAVASVMRAIPDLLLALLLASALGLGNVPGVVALTFVSIGFLVKAFAESLEVVDAKPIEGVTAHGADWVAVRTIGVFPQAAPDIAGMSLYILDSNVRSATILGFVGAGGIGYDLTQAMRLFRFDRLGLLLVSIYLMVTLIDRLSDRLRRSIA